MRLASLLVGLFAASAVAFTATPAHALPGPVDGTVTVSSMGVTCTWTDATASDMPTNNLTIDHTTINTTCVGGGGVQLAVTSDVPVTFPTPTTAALGQTNVTVTSPINCNYQVTSATLSLVTPPTPPPWKYTGTVTATEKDPKRLLCPDSVTMQFTLTFG
jgi:hypothetical protein